jgi:tetratricopeptide (TPR) repeat protein
MGETGSRDGKKLASELLWRGRPAEAMNVLERVIYADPQLKAICRPPDRYRTAEERCRVTLENCRAILSRYPNFAPAHYSMACALMSAGSVEEARGAARRAIAINPTFPVYYHIAVQCGDTAEKAAAATALEKLAAHEAAIPPDGRSMLHFLLGRLYGDEKRYAESFAHYRQANAIKRGLVAYDEAREFKRMRAIAEVFPTERLQEASGSGVPCETPIFVVGMPRSGTSLIEQILASHPCVYGAGELDLLPDFVRDGRAGADFPEGFAALAPESLRALGERYAAELTALAPTARRIVDKMPYNFLYVGLIRSIVPRAHIVHVLRDPLDTCFSCYALQFAGDIGFAYDLAELGRYYKAYAALMGHWRQVLPEGAMLEVRYETLVEDFEHEARRIVEYCGLAWDARCLKFYQSSHIVGTASAAEVRRPINRKGIGRAAPYAPWLPPLRAALE